MKFLIVIGNIGSDTTCPRFAETQVVDNMHLLTDTPGSIRKYDDAWVIGELYNRDDGSRLVATKGTLHRLLTQHWGGYVAIKPQPDGDQYEVLIDPSGGLPCYVAMTANAIILGSEAAEVLRVADLKFLISWDTVYSQLLKRDNRSDKTCLTGLQEIPPGCIGEFKNHSLTLSPGWRPELFARHARNRLPGDDSRHLRSVVQSSVCAMAQTKGKILIPVSGGLDSSVVALALSTAGADIALFTMYSEDRNGDERYYARELATHLGKELIERPYRLEDVDIGQSCVAALPRPIGVPFQQPVDQATVEIGMQSHASTVACGTGGDAIFYSSFTAAPVIDALRLGGPLSAAGALRDVCALNGCSIWTASRFAIKIGIRGGFNFPRFVDRRLLNRERFSHVEVHSHYWTAAVRDILPGRQLHVDMIGSMQNFIEGRRVLPMQAISPLFSQPIMETVLSITSPQWIRSGVDRAVAREAFADRLPSKLLRRKTKGGPGGFAAQLYMAKRLEIRSFLLDGLLARERLIDREQIEVVTALDEGEPPADYLRLLILSDAEAWARSWDRL